MRIDLTVGVYMSRSDGEEHWKALTPAAYPAAVSGQGEVRLRERMIDRLRVVLRTAPPLTHELVQLPVGTELVRVPVDYKTDTGRIHGAAPLIVEPRRSAPLSLVLRRSAWLRSQSRKTTPDRSLPSNEASRSTQ